MALPETLLTLALHAARPVLPLLARGEGKTARGVRGRRGVLKRMERWAAEHRDPARPLVWFHAPSVGEGLQARAVVEALRRRRKPDVQIVYTFFSPSAEGFARSVPADFADYLPLDFSVDVRRALAALRPTVLAFSKTDVWPALTREAERRKVRMALLSATLPAESSRLSGPARWLLGPAYRRLDRVAAISAAHAARFAALGVPEERRGVMGDARFDQVWHRAATADALAPWHRALAAAGLPVLVAGSTWPADEERLVPAVAQVTKKLPLRLVLVPHEPSPEHLARAEARLAVAGLRSVRFSAMDWDAPLPPVLVVDRTGVLGELYAAAAIAYVGGGWGSAGLHSVLEPAAFGVPTLFGPRHTNAREAAELIAAGGAHPVRDRKELRRSISGWLRDDSARTAAGAAARAYVQAGLGAAERGAEVVELLLR
ncbi:MAG: hypothetical protein M3409_09865 [Gemmatimonadota bacterium]|nr:hypothetical protein [Gemmatimonadota bacterium]